MCALPVGNSSNEVQSINLPGVYLDPPHPNTLVHGIQGELAGDLIICQSNYNFCAISYCKGRLEITRPLFFLHGELGPNLII